MNAILLFSGALTLVCIGLLAYSALAFRRNEQVYRYRIGLIQMISTAADSDLVSGRDYGWRYKVFESVSYETMLKWPWRDLDTYYPDKSFILPRAKPVSSV